MVGRPSPAWATRRATRSRDIHSVLVRAGFVPICKRSRIVRRRIHEGWYPPNIERQLWGTRVPGLLGESGFVSGVAGASPICTKPLGRRFRSFSCRHRTFPCSVRSPVGPRRPGGPRRATRSRDIHSVLVRAGVVPICKRSRIVRRGLHEGWYPANNEVHLSRTRVPGLLGESAWAYRAAQAPPICTKPLGRRFWHFRAVMETSRGRIATRGARAILGSTGNVVQD